MTNIATSPLFGSPTSQPLASSSDSCAVALPWMPILCSRPVQKIGLRAPGAPPASGTNFGTMNSEMPLLPAGAPGSRASTRWTMLAAMSCSPAEMKIFWPVMR